MYKYLYTAETVIVRIFVHACGQWLWCSWYPCGLIDDWEKQMQIEYGWFTLKPGVSGSNAIISCKKTDACHQVDNNDFWSYTKILEYALLLEENFVCLHWAVNRSFQIQHDVVVRLLEKDSMRGSCKLI